MGKRWLALGLVLASVGCSQDADRLGRICQKTASRFDGMTEGMRGKLQTGWGAMRGSVSEASLDSRVTLRLSWDIDMAGADVQVRLAGPATVELTGTVADLPQHRHAVQIARTTTGVENVIDRLTVEAEADKP